MAMDLGFISESFGKPAATQARSGDTFWFFTFGPVRGLVHPESPWRVAVGRKFSRVATHTARGDTRAAARHDRDPAVTPDTSPRDTDSETPPAGCEPAPRPARAGRPAGFRKIRHGRTRESH